MIDDLLKDARERMGKSIESTQHEFATVRTGRASPHLLDRVNVDYYGAQTPLKQIATVAATEARLLTITPYDKSSIKQIEKAILESDLGLTPSNDGNVIRLAIPELTEERRKELVKVVHGLAEEGRVAVRNIRRDCMHDLRELRKSGEAGEDEERRAEAELQKLTDAKVKDIDELLKGKEEEILRRMTDRRRSARATWRSSWTGTRAGPRAGAWASRRGTRRAPTRSSATVRHRGRPRHRAAHRVRVLDRELGPAGRRGDRHHGAVRRPPATRGARAGRGGVRLRFIGRRDRVARARCASRSSGPSSSPRTTPRAPCSWPSTTAGARRSCMPPRPTRGGGEEEFRTHLYAPDMEDPQLIIRTGGERRLSNFLLWESAYSELYFSEKMWPDFDRDEFERAVADYAARQYRFGGR